MTSRIGASLALLAALGTCLAASAAQSAAAAPLSEADRAANALAHDIFKQLIEINTTDSVGNVTTAAEAMAKRFRDAGFPAADVAVLGPNERKKNLVVRLRGSGAHRPVLLIGHLDVVEARREDWTTDPFKLIEKDGYFYGRGTQDMKDNDAIVATALVRMKQEGFKPDRDLILALTADEEGGCCNGVDWLIKNHRALVDAQFALNTDDLTLSSEHGVPKTFRLDATEKLYADYQLLVTTKGGHSSVPRADNAIYQLAAALTRIANYEFPFELNNVTRAFFQHLATEEGPEAADVRAILKTPPDPAAIARLTAHQPYYAAVMHTTCVATRLEGGHANNALPQRAQAVVNCRILPGHSQEEVRQELVRVVADREISVKYIADNGDLLDKGSERRAFAPPPLLPDVMKPLEAVVSATWPNIKIVPYMSAGASDAIYTSAAGMPTYTFSGVAVDADDDREHGRDERLPISSFYAGNLFYYRYLKALAAQ